MIARMAINQKQRWVLWVMWCTLLVIVVFPPRWWVNVERSRGSTPCPAFLLEGLGEKRGHYYDWFFNRRVADSEVCEWSGLDYWRWSTEVGLLIAIGGGLFLVLKGPRHTHPNRDQ